MNNLIATDAELPKVHMSILSGKLKEFEAVNTNTVTNSFCQSMRKSKNPKTICIKCYSDNMLRGSRKNCQPSFQRNSDLLSSGLIQDSQIPRLNRAFARFHAHGELINLTHLENLYRIARANPHVTWALWTKRKDFVKAKFNDRPPNVIHVYSNPLEDKVITKVPKYFDKVFNNVTSDHPDENCTGQKCIDCLACYKFNSNVDVIIERTKSRS